MYTNNNCFLLKLEGKKNENELDVEKKKSL